MTGEIFPISLIDLDCGKARVLAGKHRKCTCGIYAAKNSEHLRQIGYADGGICGEVYLWGTVVEHKFGWRAQFAYPKYLILPPSLLPFTLAELNARLQALIEFGTDIFVLRNGESIRLWKHGSGYDVDGLDYIINLRQKHYLWQQQERALKKGDRVALLGRGIAVVERADEGEVIAMLGNRFLGPNRPERYRPEQAEHALGMRSHVASVWS